MSWSRTRIQAPAGYVDAISPEIISASRSTDIPAFYADWFMARLHAGYAKWVNPFNQKAQYVSFYRVRFVVFWSKNPKPLLPYLDELDKRGIGYYFQFTLNDYEREKLEPRLPPLADRVATLAELSERVGPERVIWRFDPLILAADLTVDELLRRIRSLGDRLAGNVSRFVFSFADVAPYRKVQQSLRRAGVGWREFTESDMERAAEGIAALCRSWGIPAYTCAENVDLSAYGIGHGKCVDDDLILQLTDNDPALCRLFGREAGEEYPLIARPEGTRGSPKDKGQRKHCGCVISKDIGQYNTCPHLCVYCYANTSATTVDRNRHRARPENESITGS